MVSRGPMGTISRYSLLTTRMYVMEMQERLLMVAPV